MLASPFVLRMLVVDALSCGLIFDFCTVLDLVLVQFAFVPLEQVARPPPRFALL